MTTEPKLLPEGQPDDAASTATVVVKLGSRSYDVVIGAGLLARASELITARLGRTRCAIVTDANVAAHHAGPLQSGLAQRGLHVGTKILKPGEATKSFGALAELCESLLDMGVERHDTVIALGGGVVGDLAGFAASIIRRGVRVVQIPTTLLAQVDSSVGGKTGINTSHGKNLVGTFHQPSLVLADIAALATLPQREFRAGYVEAAKYGLLGDAPYFGWLEQNSSAVLAGDRSKLARAIRVAIQGKADIVARDETETGDRMLLNLGHTFGHALEAWAGYSERLLHGEAVAIGICLAFRLSEALGFAGKDSVARVESHLAACRLPTRIGDIPGTRAPEVDTLIAIMGQDKKVRDGRMTLVLAHAIGEAFLARDVATETVRDFLACQISDQA
jgi:3-dehydroquinate synthase